MRGLTPRCAQLLGFIESYSHGTHIMPSHDEMREAIGLRSKSSVSRILSELQERGHVRMAAGRSRAIELLPKITHCPHCGNYLGVKNAPATTNFHAHNTR